MTNAWSRRRFLASVLTTCLYPRQSALASVGGILVNDVHSRLNPTSVSAIEKVSTTAGIWRLVSSARHHKASLSICGARHAAGGQQFLTDGILFDSTAYNRVLKLDRTLGQLTVQSGIRWSKLLAELEVLQQNFEGKIWGVNQKQTGLDSLTVGGTLGANAHGQGLLLKPFVGDIVRFKIMNASGEILDCSRTENSELFSLAIGGYGLFGIVLDVTLQLVPREKLRRKVHRVKVTDIADAFERSVRAGYRYGHCQLNIDETSSKFLAEGVFGTYEPVSFDSALTAETLKQAEWQQLVNLVHTDKTTAFELYAKSVESSDGKVDWSDSWQNNFYLSGYHDIVDKSIKSTEAGTEILSEFYVPLKDLATFLSKAADYVRKHECNIVFSSIRFIEKDDDTFIPWARRRYACVVLNFHTARNSVSIERTMNAWSYLIDQAIALDGSFYLTYQHVANKTQILSCYPTFERFLQLKLHYDPDEVFQSDWYRFHKAMFA